MMLTGVREAHAPSAPASLGATRRKSDEYQLRTIFGSCTKRLLMFAFAPLVGSKRTSISVLDLCAHILGLISAASAIMNASIAIPWHRARTPVGNGRNRRS